jgi:hypothetical protein
LLSACTTDIDVIVLPPPPLPEAARSLVLVFEGDNELLYALDLSDRDPLLRLIAPGWTSTELGAVAFSYDSPLAFYGLSQGSLDVVAGSRSCGLKTPLAVARFDGTSRLWTEVTTDGAIGLLVDETNFGCSKVDHCRGFRAEYVELDTNLDVELLLRLDESTALMGRRDGRYYEVGRRGVTPREDLTGLPFWSGHIDAQGEIWLGGEGVIARGSRAGGFVTTSLGGPGEIVAAVDTRGEGASLEAIAVTVGDIANSDTSTLAIYRHAGGEWTLLERRLSDARSHWCDVLWIGDTALIVYGGKNGLAYRDGTFSSFTVESPLPLYQPALTSLAAHQDAGVVLGADDGFLYRMLGPTSWEPLEEGVLGNQIYAVTPAFEGFFFGGPDGYSNQYYPRSAPCIPDRVVMSEVNHALQLGPDLLVGGGNFDRDLPTKLTWLSE